MTEEAHESALNGQTKEKPPHLQRMYDEAEYLRVLLNKLALFVKTDVFKGLDQADQALLRAQQAVMTSYLVILNERIARGDTE